MSAPEVFVAGLHLRWDGVWQRPHHLLTRLARKLPVIVIEEPHGAADDRDDVRRAGDLTVIRPLRTRGWGEPLLDAQALATARGEVFERLGRRNRRGGAIDGKRHQRNVDAGQQ